MKYYIETLRKGYSWDENPEIMELPGADAKTAFCEYMRLIYECGHGHLCLRQVDGNMHGLISEWFRSDGNTPFWYYGHSFSWVPFVSALGFDPREINSTKRV